MAFEIALGKICWKPERMPRILSAREALLLVPKRKGRFEPVCRFESQFVEFSGTHRAVAPGAAPSARNSLKRDVHFASPLKEMGTKGVPADELPMVFTAVPDDGVWMRPLGDFGGLKGVRVLIGAGVIRTYWHLESTVCLEAVTEKGGVWEGRYSGSHVYFTNSKNLGKFAFVERVERDGTVGYDGFCYGYPSFAAHVYGVPIGGGCAAECGFVAG